MSDLIQDPVFVGLTRPTTMFGVQFEAFIVNFMFSTMVFLGTGNPLHILVMLPIHGLFYVISLKDPRIFSLVMMKVKSLGYCRNRVFWKANSYSPWE